MAATFGKCFQITVIGESHGTGIGVVVDGCPAGLELSETDVQEELDKRKPGQSLLTTQRKETDKARILTGVFRGKTTARPITIWIDNSDAISANYDGIRNTPRPGHADYPARIKFGGFEDYRGGGAFSGRMTACLVMAGAVAKKLIRLRKVECIAHITNIGKVGISSQVTDEDIRKKTCSSPVRCADDKAGKKMAEVIESARHNGDSVGGIVEARINGLPAGIGEPFFDSFESVLSHLVFSIPAAKGVEFGSGFAGSSKTGFENNDRYEIDKKGGISTASNNSGGILGGLTTGMPVVYRVAFKPASSIAREQVTASLLTRKRVPLRVKGRHDPCIAIRAVPVVEAVSAIACAELLIASQKLPRVVANG